MSLHRNSRLKVRVKNITAETQTIKRFTLQALDQKWLPPFSGGSHITTFLPHPSGTLERHYSLFNLTGEKGLFEIAVRLSENSKGGSSYWHQSVQVGDELSVSFPKNYFPLSFQAKHHVFYAAGIGITPFLSMMAELAEKDHSFELHCAAKSIEQCAFYEYLQKTYPNKCFFYFSGGGETNRLNSDHLMDHGIGTHVYFCGPESLIQDFTQAAKAYGYPSHNVHFERFESPKHKEQQPFQVVLKESEKQLEVSEDVSLLEVLLQNGMKVPYSCRVGGCGTCEVKVIEGEITHLDRFLTDEQRYSNQVILPCVSRGIGRLVLDL